VTGDAGSNQDLALLVARGLALGRGPASVEDAATAEPVAAAPVVAPNVNTAWCESLRMRALRRSIWASSTPAQSSRRQRENNTGGNLRVWYMKSNEIVGQMEKATDGYRKTSKKKKKSER
jgi:hypothetical protein